MARRPPRRVRRDRPSVAVPPSPGRNPPGTPPPRCCCTALTARPDVVERSAVPDSREWLHAQSQAGVLAELHGIRRAAERRAPEVG